MIFIARLHVLIYRHLLTFEVSAGPINVSLRKALCVGEVLDSSLFWLAGESGVSWLANEQATECFERLKQTMCS